MHFYPHCYPCCVNQIERVLARVGLDDAAQIRVQRAMLMIIAEMDPETTISSEVMYYLQRELQRETGLDDPLEKEKLRATREALKLLPELRAIMKKNRGGLETALRLALAGNIIDTGLMHGYHLPEVVQQALTAPLALNSIHKVRDALAKTDWVLMLADNAGETVFDRVLIETLGKRVVYAVKEHPVLNDATMRDARDAGLHEVAELVSSGSPALGTDPKFLSPEFKEMLFSAPLVIAKGMANFETLWGVLPSAFFLLQVKCPVNAAILGVRELSFVIAGGETKETA